MNITYTNETDTHHHHNHLPSNPLTLRIHEFSLLSLFNVIQPFLALITIIYDCLYLFLFVCLFDCLYVVFLSNGDVIIIIINAMYIPRCI